MGNHPYLPLAPPRSERGGNSSESLPRAGIAWGGMARVASQTDFDAVVTTIVAAFREDPLWSWMFPDLRRRAAQHATVFGLYVEGALPNGGVWMADESASAAAVFTPPGKRELSEDAEARLETFIPEALGDHAPAVLETLERFEAALPEGPPFYYLSFLGTHPGSRGRGIGMGLLGELAARADREGRPIYLESTNPANTPRYERLGFSGQAEFATPDDLHIVTTMWREPGLSR
jgi:GNAT superfamily N-acetyltransferase